MAASFNAAPSTARRTVMSVSSYEEAERAVDWLSDQKFAVEHVAIVGSGLRYIEQISGRMTTGNAAVKGLWQGALFGLFWGLLFGLFFTVDAGSFLGVLAYSAIVAAVFGAIFYAISQAAQGGRRDFDSATVTRADRYEVQVDDAFAADAERLLARMPGR